MTLKRGQSLQQGRYQVEKRLGQGGMATVYLAVDRHLDGRVVAIKENTDTAAETQVQFRREAVVLAHLVHPHLPRVIDHFIEPSGRQYLVMDYVEGADLLDIIRQRGTPLDEATVLVWIEQVMDALEYMHTWSTKDASRSTPIIHRDIKPSNIKCTSKGHIMLVDFGLAKYQMEQGTLTGARAVSPGYSPVEQYIGGTDIRSDVYALGATLYTLLTGVQPPEAPAIASGARLQPPRALNPKITRNTEHVILRAMQLQPSDRYQEIQTMRAALTRARGMTTRPIQDWPREVVASLRGNWLWGIGIGGLMLLAVFLVWNVLSQGDRLSPGNVAPAPTENSSTTNGEQSLVATGLVSATVMALLTTEPTSRPQDGTQPTAAVGEPQQGDGVATEVQTTATLATHASVVTSTSGGTATPLAGLRATENITPEEEGANVEGAETVIMETATVPATPTNTRGPTSTPIPMRAPTPTPAPPTPTPIATTAASERTILSSATPSTDNNLALQAPVLVSPAAAAALSGHQLYFQWRWDGVLQDNWGFEVRGWHSGQSHNGLHDARKTAGMRPDANGVYSLAISVPESLYNASWQWTVAIVQLDPYQRIGPEADPRSIYYQPPSPLR